MTELCGVAEGVGHFLAEREVFVCGDMQRLPIGELATAEKYSKLDMVMDDINNRYGELTHGSGRLINKSEMPNVIAPS